LQSFLAEDELAMTITIYPRLGCPPFTYPEAFPSLQDSYSKSLFWPNDATYTGNPRFKTFTRNCRMRRGSKQCINIPVYKDIHTPEGKLDDFDALEDDGGATVQLSRKSLVVPVFTAVGNGNSSALPRPIAGTRASSSSKMSLITNAMRGSSTLAGGMRFSCKSNSTFPRLSVMRKTLVR